jgi:excisionase family DNA binding protein
MEMDSPLALRPRDAARTLSISERHLWQLTHDGRIPCVRIGSGSRKTVLYPLESLRGWLASEAKSGPPPKHGGDGWTVESQAPRRPNGS